MMAGCRENVEKVALILLPRVVSITHSQLLFASYVYGKPGL